MAILTIFCIVPDLSGIADFVNAHLRGGFPAIAGNKGQNRP
jgi:hypothetical protein